MIPSLFFTATVDHSTHLSEVMRHHGVQVWPISYKTKRKERRDLIEQLRAGEIDGLASVDALGTGTDIVRAMGAFMACPCHSGTKYRQCVGRVMRPFPTPQGHRVYQDECRQRVQESLRRGVINQLIVMGTGTGKTVVAASMPSVIWQWKHGMPRGRIMFLVHRDELATQAAATFAHFNPLLRVGIEMADSYAGDAEIVIASIPTLGPATSNRLHSFLRRDFDGVIQDETHYGISSAYHKRVYEWMGVSKEQEDRDPGIALIGITATPERNDQIGLERYFDEIVYHYDLRSAIADGWLCRPVAHRVETSVDISSVRLHNGDFAAAPLGALVDNPERNEIIALKYLEICRMEGLDRPGSKIGRKPHAIIADFVDVTRLPLIVAPTLFGLRGKFDARGKDVLEQAEEIEDLQEQFPMLDLRREPNLEAIRACLREVDLLAIPETPEEIRKISRLLWVSDGQDGYRLPCMDGTMLSLRRNCLGYWQALHHKRGVVSEIEAAKKLPQAIQAAEGMISPKDLAAMRSAASWRRDPPSQKQAELLWRMSRTIRERYPERQEFWNHCLAQYNSGSRATTKGAISQQIDLITARNKASQAAK